MKYIGKKNLSPATQKKYKKTHPYSILRHLKVSVLLVLLSVLQQVLYRPQNIIEIIGSLGFNALYVTVILFYYLSTYGSLQYYLDQEQLHVREGVFFHRTYRIGHDKIHTVVFYRDWLSAFFGAEKIGVDTLAGSRRKYDIEGYFSIRSARAIRDRLHCHNTVRSSHRSHVVSVILMSFFWSNPVTGLVFIVPVINNISKLVGREAANSMVRHSIQSQWAYYIRFISPAAATLAIVILMSWAISMLLCLMRHFGLCTYRLDHYIVIVRGFITRSMTYTRLQAIASVNVDQSLLMKLLRLKSCSVSVVGSGKMKGDRGLIIAAEKADQIRRHMTTLTGIEYHELKKLSAAKNSIFSYIYLPLLALSIPLGFLILRDFLPKLRSTILFLAITSFLVVMWWLVFRIFAYRHSHVGYHRQAMIICCFHRLMVRKYYIPFQNIQKIEIVQSIFQRRSGKCNVKVFLTFEKRAVCRIKQLDKEAFLQLMREQNKILYDSACQEIPVSA